MRKGRKKIPLAYISNGILPYDETTLCQNPELVTGRKDSLCVSWGEKCKILHCWVSEGRESDWLRSEVQYLVEIEPTVAKGVCSSCWWQKTWSRYVYEMSEDTEIYPIIQVTSRKQLDGLHRKGKFERP